MSASQALATGPAGRRLRVFYATGPGNVIATFFLWRAGLDDPTISEIAYSAQIFDACRTQQHELTVESCCPEPGRVSSPGLVVRNRPGALRRASGLWFHLGQLWRALRLSLSMVRRRCDVAIVGEGGHWFVFTLPALLGVRIVPCLHCRLTPPGAHLSGVQRRIAALNSRFLRRRCWAILSASRDVSQQVRDACGPAHPPPLLEFLPTYQRGAFPHNPAPASKRPFRVLFIGRIERDKGVFDLLDAATQLGPQHDIAFDLCGRGPALVELQRAIQERRLGERFICHGYCNQAELRLRLAACHVVVVPTRSDFVEGFNQVVAEAVLAGRPVITSRVCPAVHYLAEAVYEVPADDPAGYARAIAVLADDDETYARLQSATAQLRAPLLTPDWGLGRAVERLLSAAARGAAPAARLIPEFRDILPSLETGESSGTPTGALP